MPLSCCREFWLVSNRFLARLYSSPLVIIAAIRGALQTSFLYMHLHA
jgi:hypothetical protein